MVISARRLRRSVQVRLICALLLLTGFCGTAFAEPTVFAAASTGRALDAFFAEERVEAVRSYGASGILARQIEQGAPADIFLSANPRWMAHLVEVGLVRQEDVRPVLSNSLVLISSKDLPLALEPESIAAALDGERFAMADPMSAPVGRYGQAALEDLRLWDIVAKQLVPMRNTVATVAAVERGEALLGLVYKSDVAGLETVHIVAEIPEEAHPEILYLAAPLTSSGEDEEVLELLAHLTGSSAARVFSEFGFKPFGGAK